MIWLDKNTVIVIFNKEKSILEMQKIKKKKEKKKVAGILKNKKKKNLSLKSILLNSLTNRQNYSI